MHDMPMHQICAGDSHKKLLKDCLGPSTASALCGCCLQGGLGRTARVAHLRVRHLVALEDRVLLGQSTATLGYYSCVLGDLVSTATLDAAPWQG